MCRLMLISVVIFFLALFTAGIVYAGGGGGPIIVPPGTDGIVRGNVILPNLVFVSANKDTAKGNDPAASQAPCTSGSEKDILDMEVYFTTRTSGVVSVIYCGSLDNNSEVVVDVRALVEHTPGNDMICQPGNIRWDEPTGDRGGASCHSWICEVKNDKDCGWYGKHWCKTEHSVRMQCSSSDFAQFNERVLKVYYNKWTEQTVDGVVDKW